METKKATIKRDQNDAYLILELGVENVQITLTDDNPNNIKDVFNKLLISLKGGEFNFELVDDIEDLYYHICVEYIIQLNSELKSVYSELADYGLLDEGEDLL